MLDLSLPKIMVVLFVALLVLGPERLPGMVRQAGRWLGELRRLRESVESEVKGVLGELPGAPGGAAGDGTSVNPMAGVESPFAGLHESVASIGESLRSAMGTTPAATPGDGTATVSRRPLPPPGHANRNPDGSAALPPMGGGSPDGARSATAPAGPEGSEASEGTQGTPVQGSAGDSRAVPAAADPSLN